jgi:hypothetical protein
MDKTVPALKYIMKMNEGLETKLLAFLASGLYRRAWPASCFDKPQLNKETGYKLDEWNSIPGRDFPFAAISISVLGQIILVPNWDLALFLTDEVAGSLKRPIGFYYRV